MKFYEVHNLKIFNKLLTNLKLLVSVNFELMK